MGNKSIAKKEESAITPEIVDGKDLAVAERGLAELEALAKKAFPPKRIVSLIEDLCTAEDVSMTNRGERYVTPNWGARKSGVEKAMGILHYEHKESKYSNGAPSKIVIQVLQKAEPEHKPKKEEKS